VEVEAEETAGEETAEEAEVVDTVDQEPSETQDGEE